MKNAVLLGLYLHKQNLQLSTTALYNLSHSLYSMLTGCHAMPTILAKVIRVDVCSAFMQIKAVWLDPCLVLHNR